MAFLVDGTYATGDNAFHAGEAEVSLDDELIPPEWLKDEGDIIQPIALEDSDDDEVCNGILLSKLWLNTSSIEQASR